MDNGMHALVKHVVSPAYLRFHLPVVALSTSGKSPDQYSKLRILETGPDEGPLYLAQCCSRRAMEVAGRCFLMEAAHGCDRTKIIWQRQTIIGAQTDVLSIVNILRELWIARNSGNRRNAKKAGHIGWRCRQVSCWRSAGFIQWERHV